MNVNGHSWTAIDYEEVEGKMYEIAYLYTIDNDRLLERELTRTRVW